MNAWSFFEFLFFPTLVYQREFPRTSRVRIVFVINTWLAVAAIISLMYTILSHYILPILRRVTKRLLLVRLCSSLLRWIPKPSICLYSLYTHTHTPVERVASFILAGCAIDSLQHTLYNYVRLMLLLFFSLSLSLSLSCFHSHIHAFEFVSKTCSSSQRLAKVFSFFTHLFHPQILLCV